MQVAPGNLFHAMGFLGLGFAALAACSTARWDAGLQWDHWLSYHTLLATIAAVGLLALSAGFFGRNLRLARQLVFPGKLVQDWVTAIGTLAVGLAVLWCYDDPGSPWWSAGAILTVGLAAGLLAVWRRLPAYVCISMLSLNLAGTILWLDWGAATDAGMVYTNVLCLAVASSVWSLLGHLLPSGVPALRLDDRRLPPAHLAAAVSTGLLAAFVAGVMVWNLMSGPREVVDSLGWYALLATVAAVAICLWDRSARFPLPGLYLLGMTFVGMALDARKLSACNVFWTGSSEAASFALVTAVVGWLLWRYKRLRHWLRIPDAAGRWPVEWFMRSQAVVCAVAAVAAVWIVLDLSFDAAGEHGLFGLSGRTVSLTSSLALLGATIVMAWQSAGTWRARWQYAAFGAGVLLQCCAGWARVNSTTEVPWLQRSVTFMVSAALVALVTSVGLRRAVPKTADWIVRGRRALPVLIGMAVAALVLVLAQEAFLYLFYDLARGVPMTPSSVVIVAVALAGMTVAAICFAVVPGWDPMGWTERRRTAYVYAAEVLLGLVFLHLWFTVPELFRLGIIEKYWMLLVMAAAFCGALLSELFHRRRMPVLSEPLERTAALLPLAPAIGFFLPIGAGPGLGLGLAGKSPAVWGLAAVFYGFLARTRRSAGYALASLVALTAGLWVLWHRLDFHFFQHPQLWLIPIGLAGLVAEHLNRDRLSEAQRTGLRYLALSIIYGSSTADMIIAGFGDSTTLQLFMPLVLMLLSVLGVLTGIFLRIRSFVYLGTAFLLVVIVRMVSYAAHDLGQTWVWYAFCVALGLAIIALFAVFEKRREDLQAARRRFEKWDK